MNNQAVFPPFVNQSITQKQPFLWLNDERLPMQVALAKYELTLADVHQAERRLSSFSTLLAVLFPELRASRGIIESTLLSADGFKAAMMQKGPQTARWLIKADHALPVAGSIKARGGIYEVLVHAERLALSNGLVTPRDDRVRFASTEARALFARHQVVVGSTGNLGLSIGVMASALGFRAVVHMSADAKEWKKEHLRARGVEIVEHTGDFSCAVAAGREQARGDPDAYFVDDENSEHLFLGYSVAAIRLKQQLTAQGVQVDAQHPLFVYLPCGVGGAPGGITFGLRHLLGDHVHCFFAEPVAAPCMLIRLSSTNDAPLSVNDVGLDGRTEADGLAVGQASEFVVPIMKPLVSGIFTVPDDDLFEDLYVLGQSQGMRIEPSAAAGFRGPRWLLETDLGEKYLIKHGVLPHMKNATHVLWTTGGSFLPEEEYSRFYQRGRSVWSAKSIRHRSKAL